MNRQAWKTSLNIPHPILIKDGEVRQRIKTMVLSITAPQARGTFTVNLWTAKDLYVVQKGILVGNTFQTVHEKYTPESVSAKLESVYEIPSEDEFDEIFTATSHSDAINGMLSLAKVSGTRGYLRYVYFDINEGFAGDGHVFGKVSGFPWNTEGLIIGSEELRTALALDPEKILLNNDGTLFVGTGWKAYIKSNTDVLLAENLKKHDFNLSYKNHIKLTVNAHQIISDVEKLLVLKSQKELEVVNGTISIEGFVGKVFMNNRETITLVPKNFRKALDFIGDAKVIYYNKEGIGDFKFKVISENKQVLLSN